jgi:chondroitin 4-sulfotransferase 11
MIISNQAKCIFVHIQKTGGASVEQLLRANDAGIEQNSLEGRRHISAVELRARVAPEIWGAYFKFAFVRNPWDRLVSWYHMCVQTPTANRFALYIKDNAPTFDDFLKKTTTGMAERTTRNQLDYVTDDQGEIIVDFIGRYEQLEDEFSRIKKRLSLDAELPHVNKSAHDDYRKYYTDETRDIVSKRFEKDIRHFGYAF